MPFRLRKDARAWFKDIEPQLKSEAPQFDLYYFCLMAGIASGRKADAVSEEAPEFIDYFPGEFRNRGRLIIAWFLARELKSLGITMHERSQIHGAINKLVDPRSSSQLSDAGMREINRYAAGGFDVLTETFEQRPIRLDVFLLSIAVLVDKQLCGNTPNAASPKNYSR